MGAGHHPWALVAPWWHWPAGGDGRGTAPALQKYDGPSFVNTFLGDPQRRLRMRVPGHDEVTTASGGSGLVPPAVTRTGRLKVFLPAHHRHYLVVCSLHCDVPGLPPVADPGTCQAGFVVRRSVLAATPGDLDEVRPLLRARAAALAQVSRTERRAAATRSAGRAGWLRLAGSEARREAAAAALQERGRALAEWAEAAGVRRELEGWFPLGRGADGVQPVPARPGVGTVTPMVGLGEWRPAAELPDEVEEAWLPLYPLIAPAGDTAHDAHGASIFFGVVPVPGAEVDPQGRPRFDDRSVYEIRCFVRRHDPACPRRSPAPDCRGPVTWSDPTRRYQLAAHTDLAGTAHRPVTIALPDLGQLYADALDAPVPRAGVRFAAPAGFLSRPGQPPAPPEVCSFAIPLVTIVAMFVFRLFLPIVVLLFNLWFLLLLKLCIPPQAAVSADLMAALEAQEAIDVAAAASIEANHQAALTAAATGLFGSIENGLPGAGTAAYDAMKGGGAGTAGALTLLRAVARRSPGVVEGSAPSAADLLAPDLEWEPRVERRAVVA